MTKRYYIQCKEHYAYDFILWWRPDSKGYTYHLESAGLYSEDEARSICSNREIDVAWSEDEVKAHISQAISIESLRRAGVKPTFEKPAAVYKPEKKPPPNKCLKCGRFFSFTFPDDDTCSDCSRWF